eukprot:TRINITY_DN491_c0_g1_i1.p1 TRINITY_DN491_c0_g1~~TRINITY_DN491_c0_g1_i1.p1  ORF type:complete len:188 (+),score=39.26 TRINITY_DN491_c0_g1_i1:176-739(+)
MEQAIAKVDKSKVEVKKIFVPFLLLPIDMKTRNKLEHYHQTYGTKRTDEQIVPQMIKVGKTLDINFSYGGKIGSTVNSHRLIRFGRSKGLEEQTMLKVYNYYFEKEKDITDLETLCSCGKEAGLDADEVKKMLQSDQYVDEIIKEAKSYQWKHSVDGVPFCTLNGNGVGGAESPEQLLDYFHQLNCY